MATTVITSMDTTSTGVSMVTGAITVITVSTRTGNTVVTTRIRTTTETGFISQKVDPDSESDGKTSTTAKPFERDGRRFSGRLIFIA